MTIWVIVSWVFVAILTGINVFVFLKLKGASEQMMKMAFPGAKNMNDAMAGMQKMMQGLGGMGGMPMGGMPPKGMPAGGKNMEAQMKAAMSLLQQMQKGKK